MLRQLSLFVGGMSCRRCVREVTVRLRDVPGVATLSPVTVVPQPSTAGPSPQQGTSCLRDTVEDAGYTLA